MTCTACGRENSSGRAHCEMCLTPLPVPVPSDHTVMMPRPSRPQITSPDDALELLRTGTQGQRVEARTFLAGIFEQRGMTDEAIDLLEANAKGGVEDADLFRSLARLYRAAGRTQFADAALGRAASLLMQQAPPPPVGQPPPAPPPAQYAPPPSGYPPQPYYPQAHYAPPPAPYYPPPQPAPPPSQNVVVHNVVNVRVGAQGPPMIVRLLYFLFIGCWFGFLWLGCALFLICLVITAPLGLYMIYKAPKAFFL